MSPPASLMIARRLLNPFATAITFAVVAGGVPHKGGWKVCLKFGEAVRYFRVDSHLFGLEIRVWGGNVGVCLEWPPPPIKFPVLLYQFLLLVVLAFALLEGWCT